MVALTQKIFQHIMHGFLVDGHICCETARVWLHHLGFNMSDHQKGVFFDGHDREDVIAYRRDLLDQLEKTR